MRARRTAGASLTGIASLILMYAVAIGLVLALARRLLSDFTYLGTVSSGLIVVIIILFPAALLVLVVIHLVRLLQDRAQKRPGSGLRMRFLLANICILLLAAVPQGIISITFMAGAMETWFNPEQVEAIRGGLSISIGYYSERVEELERLAQSPVLESVLRESPRQPARAWNNLRNISTRIDSFQLWNASSDSLLHFGDADLRVSPEKIAAARSGSVIRENLGTESFLRVVIPFQGSDGQEYRAMLAVHMPAGFDKNAENLTKTLEVFSQVESMQPVFLAGAMIFYAAFSVPLLLLALLVSFTLGDEIMRPIESLEEATQRVVDGDYSYRILSRSKGDISHLVNSFNSMIQELDYSRRKIRQTEKVAAWQEIAQRLAHEIKNPLTPIKLSAERLLQKHRQGADDFDDVLERSVSSIIREVDGLNTMLTEFRNFSALPKPNVSDQNLKKVLQEVYDLFRHETGVVFDFERVADDFSVPADSNMLRRVLVNLWGNAVEAMDGKGKILVRADVVQKGRSRYARIRVQDTGPGIAADQQQQVFHPYFTTKQHGTGLGLAIVERIMFDHDGAIWFETQPGDGTTFFLDFPMG